MCLQLISMLMENISVNWDSLNADSRCCWRKKNMCNPNSGTAADKKREYCSAVPAYGRNWKPSNKHREACTSMHMLVHPLSVCQISASLSTVQHSWELISEPSQSFPQGLLEECALEFPRNCFSPLMIQRTGWCHAPVQGVLGTKSPTPTESIIASLSVCILLLCQGKEKHRARVFNETREDVLKKQTIISTTSKKKKKL